MEAGSKSERIGAGGLIRRCKPKPRGPRTRMRKIQFCIDVFKKSQKPRKPRDSFQTWLDRDAESGFCPLMMDIEEAAYREARSIIKTASR
jgi:hypothetical protein